jgi:HEAT repeat protein
MQSVLGSKAAQAAAAAQAKAAQEQAAREKQLAEERAAEARREEEARIKESVAKNSAALKAPDAQTRIQAAVELGRLGTHAAAAIPHLGKALDDEDPGVGRAAANAMASIGKLAIPVLIEALTNRSQRARKNAAFALRLIGPDAREAIPALLVGLRVVLRNVASRSSRRSGRLGPWSGHTFLIWCPAAGPGG